MGNYKKIDKDDILYIKNTIQDDERVLVGENINEEYSHDELSGTSSYPDVAKRLQIRVGGLFTADVDEVGIRASRYGLQQQLCAGEAGFGPGGQQAWQERDEFVEVANEMADKLAVFVPAEGKLDGLRE